MLMGIFIFRRTSNCSNRILLEFLFLLDWLKSMTLGYLLENATGVNSRLASISSIDLTAAAATNLYTVPAGKTLKITEIVLTITTSTTFSLACTLGIGKSSSFNEWLAATAMTGLSAVGNFRLLSNSVAGLVHNIFAAGEIVAMNVTVGATATALRATADIFGYLI